MRDEKCSAAALHFYFQAWSRRYQVVSIHPSISTTSRTTAQSKQNRLKRVNC
jgi:hypothetical protein